MLAAALLFITVKPSFKNDPNPVLVKIPRGASARQTAQLLEEQGVIHSPLFFLFLVKWSGKSSILQHGAYLLEKNHYFQTVEKLKKGFTHSLKITIPEGWNSFQIARRLEAVRIIPDLEMFMKFVEKNHYEGMLFPNTYFFEPLSDFEEICQGMLEQFKKNYSEKFVQRAKELNLTQKQVLTIASIIEKESQVDFDRPLVSSVYHNRLKKGFALQADPTVQYALSNGRSWKEKLYYKDLEVQSPYNTYRVRGLPPGPICNPGLKSIEAALYPADTNYLFFVADGKGGHYFFSTYRDHIKSQLKKR